MMYAQNIVIIIKNFRFLRADHKAGIACERHTREMEKSPLSTQCAGIKSSRPDAHMCGDRGFESRPLHRRVLCEPHSSLEKEAIRQHKRRDGSRAFRLGRSICGKDIGSLVFPFLFLELGAQRHGLLWP
jgi:hypothetical protein